MTAARDYSQVPLARKLGIREGTTVVLVEAPPQLDAWLAPLPAGVRVHREATPAGRETVDVALLFATELAAMAAALDLVIPLMTAAGGIWLCSPKRASRIPTDLDFGRVQALGLTAGLVDNKVASVSEVWTGVRFVRRLRDRAVRG